MTKSRSILLVHNHPTRFVQLDLELLQPAYGVTELYLRSHRINLLKLWQKVRSHDMVFGWFASWHTFFPVLFARLQRKPSLLIIGGYDVANEPKAAYGSQRGGMKKRISQKTMRLAKQLTTFSYYSQREAIENAGLTASHLPVIYLGVPDIVGELPKKNGSPLVITVGNVWQENLFRKGLEPFVQAAVHLPDIQFALIGAWRDDAIKRLKAIAPPNLVFTNWVSDEALFDYYRCANVYVQASAHEGFGMSVAEAMLAGCIPVVTRFGALPEVVGPDGNYVDSQDPSQIAKAIQMALYAPEERRQEVRNRILQTFTLEKRRAALENLIQQQFHFHDRN